MKIAHKDPLTKARRTIRTLRRTLRAKSEASAAAALQKVYLQTRIATLEREAQDKADKLLPQKQAMLRELATLVHATSRAVRTTMWSIAPHARVR